MPDYQKFMLTNRKIGVQRYDFFLEKGNELYKLFEKLKGRFERFYFFDKFGYSGDSKKHYSKILLLFFKSKRKDLRSSPFLTFTIFT
jgi:hypothetical protein